MRNLDLDVRSTGLGVERSGGRANPERRASTPALPKKGFSLVELLVVIAVMATLATLTVGGVLKTLKNTRVRRINAMCASLQTALMGYKAQEGRWPCKLEPGKINNSSTIDDGNNPFQRERNQYLSIFTGENNWLVFEPLIPQRGTSKGYYLSTSEFFTRTKMPEKGKRKGGTRVVSLREAVDEGARPFPLGYPLPDDQTYFIYFRVEFNLQTDSVTVSRDGGAEDAARKRRQGR